MTEYDWSNSDLAISADGKGMLCYGDAGKVAYHQNIVEIKGWKAGCTTPFVCENLHKKNVKFRQQIRKAVASGGFLAIIIK